MKPPRFLRFILLHVFQFFSLLFAFRILFWLFFVELDSSIPVDSIPRALSLGARFDLRLALLVTLPFTLLVIIRGDRFFNRRLSWKIGQLYLLILYLALLLFYAFDLGYYTYMGARINASILRFFNDVAISARMVWESYPVVWLLSGIALFIFLLWKWFRVQYARFARLRKRLSSRKMLTASIVFVVLFYAAGIYGSLSWFPLRWSQAHFSKHPGVTSLALNPVLFFLDSFKFRNEGFDLERTKRYYPLIAEHLGVDNIAGKSLVFARRSKGNEIRENGPDRPNIIMVMLESVGAARLGVFGNPLKGTPNLDRLARDGILYENFFVPANGTARTVFAWVTGIPDVTQLKTASRNPLMIDQRTIADQIGGYERYYFLGGNANWANIRGVFQNNISGLRVYEEGSYESPRVDVWGISDYDLMHEADAILKESPRPFIAFLQTASYHAPYTIPENCGDFQSIGDEEVDPEKLAASGYMTASQFNSMRFMDYNIGQLMSLAEESGYLEDTIFAFFGDHNGTTRAFQFMERDEYALGISQLHVPLILYAPGLIEPRVESKPASLLDLFPTLADLAGIPYTNYTLGVSLADGSLENRGAFLSLDYGGRPSIGLVGDRFLLMRPLDVDSPELYDMGDHTGIRDLAAEFPEITKAMNDLTVGIYEGARYLLYNNQKQ